MKIVILESETINPGDLSWSLLETLGDLTVYPRTLSQDIHERIGDADAVFFSKINMTEDIIKAHPKIKFLGITATGTDNFDIDAARNAEIACCNVPGYATDAVAQHTFALILALTNHVGLHNAHVHDGGWNEARGFCYWTKNLTLLYGKSIGIIGYGNIGRKVAQIAESFGMKVNIYSQDPARAIQSDFVSLHIPSTPETYDFIDQKRIAAMKDGVFLINTARGTLVNEKDVITALNSGKISGFATDVLKKEPPSPNHPFLQMENVIITPHNAWCPSETRQIVCEVCYENLKSFISGGSLNRVD